MTFREFSELEDIVGAEVHPARVGVEVAIGHRGSSDGFVHRHGSRQARRASTSAQGVCEYAQETTETQRETIATDVRPIPSLVNLILSNLNSIYKHYGLARIVLSYGFAILGTIEV